MLVGAVVQGAAQPPPHEGTGTSTSRVSTFCDGITTAQSSRARSARLWLYARHLQSSIWHYRLRFAGGSGHDRGPLSLGCQSAGFAEKEQEAFRPQFSASRDILSQTLGVVE
jgi:hypothetical protein